MQTTKRVWVAATLDTKREEANYVCALLEAAGVPVALADISTSGSSVPAATHTHFSPEDIAACHPQSRSAVFTGDRGTAIAAMSAAFDRFVRSRDDIGGMLGLGGSGGTAMITRGMRALPTGVPKLMVSTMASGNVASYVGACDITMAYSVTDMTGLNRISRRVLGNAAHAMAGMVLRSVPQANEARPARC